MEVPGYTELRELGHGGTGRVMLAVRDSDGEHVAIKHLARELRHDEEFAERFRTEARVIRELDSPHIARLLDHLDEPAVIVMELVDGVPLRHLLREEGATGPEAALTVLKGSLLGLAEAHRHGIVHRDFKPENVIVTEDGHSKLVDFGVAARTGEAAPMMGTPAYMAPEQWANALAGPASDIYAATVVCYECLAGRRPFTAGDVTALAYRHQHAEPSMAGVDGRMHDLLRRGLAKDPAQRPASAEEFLAELEEAAAAAYGSRWEARGRSRLAALTVPFLGLRPLAQPASEVGTALVQTTLTPVAKLAITSGLVLATAVAVVSTFLIWNDRPARVTDAAAPISPAVTGPPRASATAPVTPPVSPSGSPSAGPSSTAPAWPTGGPPTEAVGPTRAPTYAPTTRPTSGPTGEPTREPTRVPTREPEPEPTRSQPTRTEPTRTEPTRPEPTRTEPTGTASQEPPPVTSAPDLSPPPAGEPLLSVSVSVSVNLPILGGDGPLDADVGLGLGSSLLGLAVVPGSVLLGRHLVVRRTRRPRSLPPHADKS